MRGDDIKWHVCGSVSKQPGRLTSVISQLALTLLQQVFIGDRRLRAGSRSCLTRMADSEHILIYRAGPWGTSHWVKHIRLWLLGDFQTCREDFCTAVTLKMNLLSSPTWKLNKFTSLHLKDKELDTNIFPVSKRICVQLPKLLTCSNHKHVTLWNSGYHNIYVLIISFIYASIFFSTC